MITITQNDARGGLPPPPSHPPRLQNHSITIPITTIITIIVIITITAINPIITIIIIIIMTHNGNV